MKKLVNVVAGAMVALAMGCGGGDDASRDGGGDAAAMGGFTGDAGAVDAAADTGGSAQTGGMGGVGGAAGMASGGAAGAAAGDLDSSFKISTTRGIEALALQADGKILAGGMFTSLNGVERHRIARLETNGDVDQGFSSPQAVTNNIITTIIPLPDGKAIVGGNVNSQYIRRIGRLNADGSVDMSFNGGNPGNGGAQGSVVVAVRQPDGKILIGGYFSSYNEQPRGRIARLNADGTLDTTFTTPMGGFGPSLSNPYVTSIALQADNKIIVGGSFKTYGATARNSLVRLNVDGSLDGTFDPGQGGSNVAPTVRAVVVLGDGKILAGGAFTDYNKLGKHYLVRLNADGSPDATFTSPFKTDDSIRFVSALLVQPDGKIWVGGNFTQAHLTGRDYLARLNADGTLDSHDPGVGAIFGTVFALVRQSDGKIVAGGDQGILRLKNGTP